MKDERSIADSKTKLADAVREFSPLRPKKYAALWPFKDEIELLRSKKASCRVVRDLLQQANVTVSLDTVARFCREVLEGRQGRPATKAAGVRRVNGATSEARPTSERVASAPASENPTPASQKIVQLLSEQRPPEDAEAPNESRRRGPRIADPNNV